MSDIWDEVGDVFGGDDAGAAWTEVQDDGSAPPTDGTFSWNAAEDDSVADAAAEVFVDEGSPWTETYETPDWLYNDG